MHSSQDADGNSLAAPLSVSLTSQPWLRTCFGELGQTTNLSCLHSLAQDRDVSCELCISIFSPNFPRPYPLRPRPWSSQSQTLPKFLKGGCTSQFDSCSFPTYHPPPNKSSSGTKTNMRVPTRTMDRWGFVEMASRGCVGANRGFGSLLLTTSSGPEPRNALSTSDPPNINYRRQYVRHPCIHPHTAIQTASFFSLRRHRQCLV